MFSISFGNDRERRRGNFHFLSSYRTATFSTCPRSYEAYTANHCKELALGVLISNWEKTGVLIPGKPLSNFSLITVRYDQCFIIYV